MPKVSPKITTQTEAWLKSNFKTLNQGAGYAVEAFPILIKRALRELEGQFAAEELCLIIDVFNATTLTPQLVGQQLVPKVEDGIDLDGLAQKWGAAGDTLLDKLRNLHYLQATALEIWACNFWHGKEKNLGEYVSQFG